jgi:hypothetical protein
VLAVNEELIGLYWRIGSEILERQERGWGAKVVSTLSRDPRRAFPEMKGLAERNLRYMRDFRSWPDESCSNTTSPLGAMSGTARR